MSELIIPERRKQSFGRWFKQLGWKHIVGLIVVVYSLFPILYIISTSLTDMGGISNGTLFGQITFMNYQELVDPNNEFLRWAGNTIFIASVTSIGSVFLSA